MGRRKGISLEMLLKKGDKNCQSLAAVRTGAGFYPRILWRGKGFKHNGGQAVRGTALADPQCVEF